APRPPSRWLPSAGVPGCSSCSRRFRPTPRARRASGFQLAPPPHEAVLEAAAHELVERAGGELLFPVDRPVAREVVHVARELGRQEDAQVLVLRLACNFSRCHDPHCSPFFFLQLIIQATGLFFFFFSSRRRHTRYSD